MTHYRHIEWFGASAASADLRDLLAEAGFAFSQRGVADAIRPARLYLPSGKPRLQAPW